MPLSFLAPFRNLTLEDAKRVIGAAVSSLDQRVNSTDTLGVWTSYVPYGVISPHRISRAYVQGDHWQGGTAWMGPRPGPLEEAFTETMEEIQRGFVSKNAIGEVVGRHVDGVLGHEPMWSFAPLKALKQGEEMPAETARLKAELEAKLTSWWNRRRIHPMLQELATTLLLAERAPLRVYIPADRLEEVEVDNGNGTTTRRRRITVASFDEALELLWLEHPMPESAHVALDPRSKEYVGLVVMQRARGLADQATTPEERVELTFLVGDVTAPRTVIRTVEGGNAVETPEFDLGGRLTVYEAERPLFVTPQMWQSQRALNLAKSMAARATITAGYLERTIFNASMPGEWELDEQGRKVRWKQYPYVTGAGVTSTLEGVRVKDKEGNETITTPSIHHREPVDTEPILAVARSEYIDIIEEAQQEHTLAYANRQASGKTHEQARADFVSSLGKTAGALNPAGEWLLGTIVMLAEALSGKRTYSNLLRPVFACRLDRGPVTSEERTAIDGSIKSGSLSRETGMQMQGVIDVDAEIAKLDSEPGAGFALIERQATVIAQLTSSGSTLEGALAFVGIIDPDPEAEEDPAAEALVELMLGTTARVEGGLEAEEERREVDDTDPDFESPAPGGDEDDDEEDTRGGA